jgi:hypothetical protein
MKQTAVEWLESRFIQTEDNLYAEDFTKAKEMEKQQIENAYWDGGQDIPLTEKRCEQYYNETFKQQ